jgi:uncharacterized SAM-binding protein YcdF (DUF218 family)
MATKVILGLGGNINRLDKAIELALTNSPSYLIISSESDPAACLQKVKNAGLDPSRVILDYTAWDTVTNFTNTKRIVDALGPDELLVVTDGFHMLRSMTIGRLVYWGSKTKVTAHPSSPKNRDEDLKLVLLDTFRALVSRLTGQTFYDQSVYDRRISYFFEDYYRSRKLQGG